MPWARRGLTVALTTPDTLGAGDAFAGGFLLSLSRGADLGGALRAGCDAATAALA